MPSSPGHPPGSIARPLAWWRWKQLQCHGAPRATERNAKCLFPSSLKSLRHITRHPLSLGSGLCVHRKIKFELIFCCGAAPDDLETRRGCRLDNQTIPAFFPSRLTVAWQIAWPTVAKKKPRRCGRISKKAGGRSPRLRKMHATDREGISRAAHL